MNGEQIMSIRLATVAGRFYPGDADELRRAVRGMLAEATRLTAHETATEAAPVKALIAPHAGYVYSGPIAAAAYARLQPQREKITRVVLLGPSHRIGFAGLATSDAIAFATPLGDVPLARQAIDKLVRDEPAVSVLEAAHAHEHSLEVHLPFLVETVVSFDLLPLVFGDTTADEVAAVLKRVWGGPETLIVISSDLSHYQDHAAARRLDRATARAIEQLREDDIDEEQACGRLAIQGLLRVAVEHKLRATTLDLRTSGDTAGPKDQVVGYGAWIFTP